MRVCQKNNNTRKAVFYTIFLPIARDFRASVLFFSGKVPFRPGRALPIGGDLRGHPPLFQAAVHPEIHERIEAGEHRHGEEHSRHAEKAAAHQNGDDDPQAGKSRPPAEDLGADDVAVHLLEGEDEHQEVKRLDGRIQQDQKQAGDRAEERAEEGDHVGHAHDHGHQRRVREFEDCGEEEAQNADNKRVQQLAYIIQARDTHIITYNQLSDDELLADFEISEGEIRLVKE